MMPSHPALFVHLIKVAGVAVNVQLHAASLVCDDHIFLHSTVMEDVFDLVHGCLGWVTLLSGNGTDGDESP